MMPLTAAFVVANRTVWEQAHACIQNLPIRLAIEHPVGHTEAADVDELLDRIERHRIDVVLLETSLVGIPLDEFMRRLRTTASQPAVFVLNPDASPDVILEALRAGANEYLYPPLAESLRDALQRLSATRSKGGSDGVKALGKVFGFLSAQGGCGATTFAAHIALELARQTKQPVLLADLDFEAGILRFLMKTKNTYSVRDALDNLHRLDASLWKALVSSVAEKLDVIPANDEVAAKRSPSAEEMMHLLRFVRSTYPISVVDFGRHVSIAALHSLPEMEGMYVVTTPDTRSLQQTVRAIHAIEHRGFSSSRIRVLLNRVREKKTDLNAVAQTLGRLPEGTFRDEHLALYDAYSEGRFLPASNLLAKEFHQLAESIRTPAGLPKPQKAEKPETRGFSLKSFFQKVPGLGRDQAQGARDQRAQA